VNRNWLDSAIAWLAPVAGARRMQARAALEIWRTYEGAKNTRRTENWTAAGTSPNAAISSSLGTLRNRARQMVRDNPHASRALQALRAKCVGTGITARVEKTVRKPWAHFVKTCDVEGDLDLNGIQSLAAGTEFEAGEVLVRRIRTVDPANPLKLQLLEPDYIDSAKFEAFGDNYIIAGVEIDRLGRRQAMWLFDQHPGEITTPWHRNYTSQRVAMSELIHFYEKLRPGQLRGGPRFASSLIRSRDLDEYREALLVKRKIEACFAAFVIGGAPNVPLGQAVTDSETGKRTETLAPGMIEYVPAGQDVKFANPSSSAGESEYTRDELQAIAAGIGVTYEQMTGDLRGVNFSSIRAGEINLREIVEAWRWVYFVPMFCERVYSWFEEAYWTAGQIRTTGYDVVWTAPRWQWVDPAKDVDAMKEEVRGGFSSLSEKIRALGYDPDEVFDEIEKERVKLKAKGIVVDTDAAVSSKAAAPAKDDGDGGAGDGDEGSPKDAKDGRGGVAVTVNNLDDRLGGPLELVAVAMDAAASSQKNSAVEVSGLAHAVTDGQRETAAALRQMADASTALTQAVAESSARNAEASTRLQESQLALAEAQRATAGELRGVGAELRKPFTKLLFDAQGNPIGSRKVDKIPGEESE
jgi:lambda family phage portal protein